LSRQKKVSKEKAITLLAALAEANWPQWLAVGFVERAVILMTGEGDWQLVLGAWCLVLGAWCLAVNSVMT
jgi:hypothetical protein